ncbi:FBD-associated F-box protein At5g56370-like [Miscanthus floridulus]|uniref:FBD-associated F-box protein At5g56370-like n=1 Tax=Miscanthus floridulus TaxID=154761 RepID=UPI003458DC8D
MEEIGGDIVENNRAYKLATATTILSLLPLPVVGHTQVLSHRWRRLWPSASLHLLDSHLPIPASSLSAVVSRILASHRGNTARFHLLIAHPSASDFDSWIRSLAAKNFLELVVRHPSDETVRLPPSFLSFRSLRTAELTNCSLPEDGTGGGEVYFPHLSEFTLKHAGDRLLHASPRGPTSKASAPAVSLP